MPKLIIEGLLIPRSSGKDSARETLVIVTRFRNPEDEGE